MDDSVKQYFDKWNMIVNLNDRDGGDSCHRLGQYYFALWWWNKKGLPTEFYEPNKILLIHRFINDLHKISRPGTLIRHPFKGSWVSDHDRMSRDQFTPVMACIVVFKKLKLLSFGVALGFMFRAMFFTNTRDNAATLGNHGTVYKHDDDGNPVKRNYDWKVPDICGLEMFALFIRGTRFWPMYPALIIFDIQTMFVALWWRYVNKTEDDLSNHLIVCATGKYVMPTPTMWIANKINNYFDLNERNKKYWNDKQRPKFMFYLWQPILLEVFGH